MLFQNVSKIVKVNLSFGEKAVISSLCKLNIKSKNFFYKRCSVFYVICECHSWLYSQLIQPSTHPPGKVFSQLQLMKYLYLIIIGSVCISQQASKQLAEASLSLFPPHPQIKSLQGSRFFAAAHPSFHLQPQLAYFLYFQSSTQIWQIQEIPQKFWKHNFKLLDPHWKKCTSPSSQVVFQPEYGAQTFPQSL